MMQDLSHVPTPALAAMVQQGSFAALAEMQKRAKAAQLNAAAARNQALQSRQPPTVAQQTAAQAMAGEHAGLGAYAAEPEVPEERTYAGGGDVDSTISDLTRGAGSWRGVEPVTSEDVSQMSPAERFLRWIQEQGAAAKDAWKRSDAGREWGALAAADSGRYTPDAYDINEDRRSASAALPSGTATAIPPQQTSTPKPPVAGLAAAVTPRNIVAGERQQQAAAQEALDSGTFDTAEDAPTATEEPTPAGLAAAAQPTGSARATDRQRANDAARGALDAQYAYQQMMLERMKPRAQTWQEQLAEIGNALAGRQGPYAASALQSLAGAANPLLQADAKRAQAQADWDMRGMQLGIDRAKALSGQEGLEIKGKQSDDAQDRADAKQALLEQKEANLDKYRTAALSQRALMEKTRLALQQARIGKGASKMTLQERMMLEAFKQGNPNLAIATIQKNNPGLPPAEMQALIAEGLQTMRAVQAERYATANRLAGATIPPAAAGASGQQLGQPKWDTK